jgi:hypothetical protein
MAYKNQKKNKTHRIEISKKRNSYRHAKKKEKWYEKHRPVKRMSLDEMEAIISNL